MTRRDLLAAAALVAVVLTLTARVWGRGAVFFNHGDLFTYHWPLRHLTAASLHEGRLPFWNPYILLGVPHAANSQAALFYPPALLGAVLPVGWALTLDQLLHLSWAGLGALLLGRAHGLPRAAALAAAFAYALSPFLVGRVAAGIPTLVASLAWAPWAWLAWLSGGAPLLAAVFALQFLSGHPQFLVVNAAGMALWAAFSARRAALWGRLAAGAAGAMLLAAAQWPGTVELLRLSNRSGWPAEFAASYALEPAQLVRWLLPPAFPSPVDAAWAGPASVYYETAVGWLGALALAAAAFGAAKGRRRAPALALAAAGLLLALGVHGPLAPLQALPGATFLRTAARWSFVSTWGLWLLAAAGLAALARRLGPRAALLPLVAVVELAAWDARFLAPQDPAPFMAPAEAARRLFDPRFRVLTDPELANPNKTALYRLRNVNGYEAFYPASAARWAAEAEGAPAADSSRVLVSKWRSSASERAGIAARLGPGGAETTRAAWPLATFAAADGKRLLPDPLPSAPRPERRRVAGTPPRGAAAVVIAETYWPGWRARLNGVEVPLARWGPAFQAVPLPSPPPAAIALELDFVPTGFPYLLILSAAAWAAWASAIARRGAA